jgi:hypothetical protein
MPREPEVLRDIADRQLAAQLGAGSLKPLREPAVRFHEAQPPPPGPARLTAHVPLRHDQINTRVREIQVSHTSRAVAMVRPAHLPAAPAHRPFPGLHFQGDRRPGFPASYLPTVCSAGTTHANGLYGAIPGVDTASSWLAASVGFSTSLIRRPEAGAHPFPTLDCTDIREEP